MKYLAVLLMIILSGCAAAVITIGRDFDSSKIKNVQRGKTTKKDVYKFFGEPYQRSVFETYETWNYVFLVTNSDAISMSSSAMSFTSIQSNTNTKRMEIVFDTLGVIKSFNYTLPGLGESLQSKEIDLDTTTEIFSKTFDPPKEAMINYGDFGTIVVDVVGETEHSYRVIIHGSKKVVTLVKAKVISIEWIK
jgi:outer membrane protein assembly factor BamE (lipoprotein component of BamABCDE complex)